MITEPKINNEGLISLLDRSYDLRIYNLVFVPKGESSWGFEVITESKKFFLKIYKDLGLSSKAFDFTFKLYSKCGIQNISHPIETKHGDFILNFEGRKVVLFNFIEGKIEAESCLTIEQLEKVGKLLAQVHKSVEIIGPYGVIEGFDNLFSERVVNLYRGLEKIKPTNEIQKEAKDIYNKYQSRFLNELTLLDEVGNKLKNSQVEFVNCHGEPSPGNIIVSPNGDVYLIDWDFPIYAPKERDLLFFTGDEVRQNAVITGYGIQQDQLNKDIVGFYSHQWNVQEIEDFGHRFFFEGITELEMRHNLKELKHFLKYSALG